jgi:hypothetical protein
MNAALLLIFYIQNVEVNRALTKQFLGVKVKRKTTINWSDNGEINILFILASFFKCA